MKARKMLDEQWNNNNEQGKEYGNNSDIRLEFASNIRIILKSFPLFHFADKKETTRETEEGAVERRQQRANAC